MFESSLRATNGVGHLLPIQLFRVDSGSARVVAGSAGARQAGSWVHGPRHERRYLFKMGREIPSDSG